MKKISALVLLCSLGFAVHAQLIDPLTGSLAPYTQTIILAQNSDGPLNFATSASGLQVSRPGFTATGSGAAQQDLLLRNDFSLSPGNTLRVSISGLGTAAANADFGIALASQVNPIPAVWTTGTVSSRSNFLAMYVKPGNSQVGAIGFNGTANSYSSGGITPPGGSYSAINGLWITETGANIFSLGYTTSGGDVTVGSGITFTGASIDNSLGFYGDVRANLTSPAFFTNLRITPVPEPSTLALLGVAGLFAIVRRKK